MQQKRKLQRKTQKNYPKVREFFISSQFRKTTVYKEFYMYINEITELNVLVKNKI